MARDELFRLKRPGFSARAWFESLFKAGVAVALFVLVLLLSGTLRITAPASVVQDVLAELRAIHTSAASLGLETDAAAARDLIRRSLARLEALATRVEAETRINDLFRDRLKAQIHNEWRWWRALWDSRGTSLGKPAQATSAAQAPAQARKRRTGN